MSWNAFEHSGIADALSYTENQIAGTALKLSKNNNVQAWRRINSSQWVMAMPVARIDLLEVCSEEQKARLVRDVEQAISDAITVPVERVKIVLIDQTLMGTGGMDANAH